MATATATGIISSNLGNFPKSAQKIYHLLESEGPMKPQSITIKADLSARTVRYALSLLVAEGLVKKQISLRDSRQAIYSLVQPSSEITERK